MTRNECIMKCALRNIEVNLTGPDNRHERIADSLARAVAALEQVATSSKSYLCYCGWGCHQEEIDD